MGITGTSAAFPIEFVAPRTEWVCAILKLQGAPGWRGHRPQRKVTAVVLLMNKMRLSDGFMNHCVHLLMLLSVLLFQKNNNKNKAPFGSRWQPWRLQSYSQIMASKDQLGLS